MHTTNFLTKKGLFYLYKYLFIELQGLICAFFRRSAYKIVYQSVIDFSPKTGKNIHRVEFGKILKCQLSNVQDGHRAEE